MRLLHITATHLNLAGGIPVVLRDLVCAQNKINELEARVLSVKADISNMNSEYFDRVDVEGFGKYISNYLPDVVIFHSHYYFEYNKIYRYLIKRDIPYFIEPHGSFGRAALEKSKYKKMVANKLVFRRFMRNAKGYIFLNENEKEDSQFRTMNDIVIPNGIKQSDIMHDEMSNKNEWFFYFIGRFDVNHKGLDYLFDALDILEKEKTYIQLRFYGKGSEREVNYINSRIENYQFIEVSNCGPLYGEEQRNELQQCGIMVLTSRYEGFPMTVLEAWMYGNPVLVSPGTNVSDEVKSSELGWVTKLDASSIALTIKMAQESYNKNRCYYIRRTANYVESNYTWEKIAQKSYNSLCDALY